MPCLYYKDEGGDGTRGLDPPKCHKYYLMSRNCSLIVGSMFFSHVKHDEEKIFTVK